MQTLKIPIILFILFTFASSACNTVVPPISLDAVPIYPGAQPLDPSEHPIAASAARQVKQAMANGHKNEMRAFLLPKGTTGAQVKQFYVSKLTLLGGQVIISLGDDAPFGAIELNHGTQSLSVSYDAMIGAQPPLLLIESFIPNGNR